ncbi:hypothetical protein ES703_41034 [subsurface metagenome]
MSKGPKVGLVTRQEIVLPPELVAQIETCVRGCVVDLLPSVLEEYFSRVRTDEVEEIILRQISKESATEQILAYITDNPGARTSDIIIQLALDDEQVIQILKELQDGEVLEGRDLE